MVNIMDPEDIEKGSNQSKETTCNNSDTSNTDRTSSVSGFEKHNNEYVVVPITSSSSETEREDSGIAMIPPEVVAGDDNSDDKGCDNNNGRSFVNGSGSSFHLSASEGKNPTALEGRRTSSLELRSVPVDILFKPSPSEIASILSDDNLEASNREGSIGTKSDWLHKLCLRPGLSLKTQMMLSFGTINFVTILFVVAVCIILTAVAGRNVHADASTTFEMLGLETQGKTSRYLAESLSPRLMSFDLLDFMHEVTLDRFHGYPEPSDLYVPFLDKVSGTNKYPIIGPPMPLQWNLDSNLNSETADEHVQSRWKYYQNRPANTVHAGFHFQGICNPNATTVTEPGYIEEECTEANNQLPTGGTVRPSDLTEMIHKKGSDIIPILRLLFETREDVRDMGVYFMNNGAGASITYPHYTMVPNSTYISAGCEWMNQPNPYDPSRTIGTQAMIDNCREEGVVVDTSLYNPMERQWCFEQALNPDETIVSIGPDAWDNGNWLLFFGKALYDRITNDLVGCTYVGTSLRTVNGELNKAKVTPLSDIMIATWNRDGTVVASSREVEEDGRVFPVYESNIGVSEGKFEELLNLVDFDTEWDPVEVRSKYENFTYLSDSNYFVSSYPVPSIPNEYDKKYRPYFLLFAATPAEEVFKELKNVETIVDDKVGEVTIFSILVGLIGLLISTLIIVLMANMLTSPLRSMNDVAQEIVDNFGDPTKEKKIMESGDMISKESRCTPKTELSDVVKEFNKLVKSFSGSSMAKSERGKNTEVENLFTLTNEFSELYSKRGDSTFAYKIEQPYTDENDFINYGSNQNSSSTTATTYVNSKPSKSGGFSPLFLWTVGLIVTPLIITSAIISAVVMSTVSVSFAEGMNDAKEYFVDFQTNALSVHARLRSDLVSEITSEATHDLHVLTRISEWLLFGAIDRADSFTSMTSAQDQCKTYGNVSECPFVIENTNCDCEFNETACLQDNWPARASKAQEVYFTCQALGAAADGDRNSSGFPDKMFSIEGNVWWDDQERLPGWEKGSNASGHDTSYDRMRVISAVPIFQALYNYNPSDGTKLGTYVMFEADGCYTAYSSGCDRAEGHILGARWNSDEENGAALLRPELCPLGKIGFDPRCVSMQI